MSYQPLVSALVDRMCECNSSQRDFPRWRGGWQDEIRGWGSPHGWIQGAYSGRWETGNSDRPFASSGPWSRSRIHEACRQSEGYENS